MAFCPLLNDNMLYLWTNNYHVSRLLMQHMPKHQKVALSTLKDNSLLKDDLSVL
jgi:hypothetical protein